MKLVWQYLKKYKRETFLAPFFKLVEAVFELCVPLVVARLIDKNIPSGSVEPVRNSVLILALLGVLGFLAALVAQFFAAKAAIKTAGNLRYDVFKHILNLPREAMQRHGDSALIARTTADVASVQDGINLTLRLLLRSPLIAIGAAIMALTVNFNASFPSVIAILAAFGMIMLIMKYAIPRIKAANFLSEVLLTRLRETLQGARVVRAFCREKAETAKFSSDATKHEAAERRAGRLNILTNPFAYIIINLAVAAVLSRGATKVYFGTISQGELVALCNYVLLILVELVKLANLMVSINTALASAKRIEALLYTDNASGLGVAQTIDHSSYTNNEPAPALEFDGAGFSYTGAHGGELSGISFTLRPGESLGIIGGTGSGKTTLAALIRGDFLPTEGNVRIFGFDVTQIPSKLLNQYVASVAQKSAVISGTIGENIKMGAPWVSDKAVVSALALAQATEFVEKMGGVDAVLSVSGKNLSGGQKQRLNIARALARSPRILVLDDAFSALDYTTESRVRQALSSLKGRFTQVIISQRVVSVQHLDRILVLHNGKMVGLAPHDELRRTCKIYNEICVSQEYAGGIK